MPGTILSPTTVHPEERVGNLKKNYLVEGMVIFHELCISLIYLRLGQRVGDEMLLRSLLPWREKSKKYPMRNLTESLPQKNET